MLENNKEYDLNISYYVKFRSKYEQHHDVLSKHLGETLSLEVRNCDESIISFTQQPYTELFYNSVENIVLKRTMTNLFC